MRLNHSTLAERTYHTLKDYILTGHFEPGQRLQLEAVSKELGISPTPVREAFFRLEKEGLLELRARKGAYVRMLDQEVVRQSYEVREVLEGLSARLATEKATRADREELKKINNEFHRAIEKKNIGNALEADIRFHNKLAAIANNEKLKEIINNYFFTNLFSNTGASTLFLENGDKTFSRHEELINAIESRDAVKAENVMRDQIREGVSMVLSVLLTQQ